MSFGKLIHWLGILLILFVCFYDPIQGKPENVLAHRSYAAILFGFALTILGIERERDGKKVCLMVLLGDWLLYQDEEEEEPSKSEPVKPDGKAPSNEESTPGVSDAAPNAPGPAEGEPKT